MLERIEKIRAKTRALRFVLEGRVQHVRVCVRR